MLPPVEELESKTATRERSLNTGAEQNSYAQLSVTDRNRSARGSFLSVLKNKWFLLIVALAAVGFVGAYAFKTNEKPQYFTAKAERGDLRAVVEATGTINAVTTVQVGSQVSGTISNLYADFNSRVKKGQVVARIDPSIFMGNLMQSQADLDNARASLGVAQANLAKSKAESLQTKQDLDRTKSLAQAGVMSQQQLDVSQANFDASVAVVNSSQASVAQAQAQVKQRQAAVTVAQTNVDHAVIIAPIDGTVVARSVDVGQTVAASLQAPTLFTIAQDLTKMQVYAKTDESDVGMIHAGQNVSFKVDAFPKDIFSGRVVQVRMNATTVQNVVTYDTIVEFDNPEMKLFPGMTAYVTIPVQQAQNALKIPNGALRYKPDMKPDDLKALLAKYGMDQGNGGQNGRTAAAGTAPGTAAAATPQTAAAQNGRAGGQFGSESTQRRQAAASTDQSAAPADDKQPKQAKAEVATLWKVTGPEKTLQPVRVRIGITDHTMTEVVQVLKGDLKEGDELVIGSSTKGVTTGAAGGARAPGVGGAGGGARPGGR